MVKYCSWCKTDRNTRSDTAVLSSDEHGKLGEFEHYFCGTCGYAIASEFRKYSWWVEDEGGESGPFDFKLEAMQKARNTPGLDVRVRARLGVVE
jgi:hypothetical protein